MAANAAGDAGETSYLGSMWSYGSSIVNSIMGWDNLEVVKTSEDGSEEAGSSGKAGTMEERQAMFKQLTSYIGKDVQSLVRGTRTLARSLARARAAGAPAPPTR